MTSSQPTLKGILADFNLKDDKVLEILAKKLDAKVETLKQRLKPSVRSPKSFLEKAERVAEDALEETRLEVQAVNDRFSRANFSLYYPDFPSIPIDRLYSEPNMLSDRATGSNGQSGGSPRWNKWLDELVQRIKWLYQDRKTSDRTKRGGENGRHAKTIIMGSPGSGKTTILKKILLFLQAKGRNQAASTSAFGQGDFTVLFLPLAVYNDYSPSSLFEALKSYYVDVRMLESPIPFERFLKREIELRRLVILLDSFEEANGKARDRILKHISRLGCTVPLVISSRYVFPRIDDNGLHVYHLGGLNHQQIQDHLELLIGTIESEQKERGIDRQELTEKLKKIQDHLKKWRWLATQAVDFRSETSTPGASLYTNEKEFRSRKNRNAAEALEILSTPIYLNLCIVNFLRREITSSISIESLILNYLDFLLREWRMSRSDHQTEASDPSDIADLERLLGYAAFLFTTREQFGKDRLSIAELKEHLEEFFKQEIDQKSSTKDIISKLVEQLIENAKTAQIFSTGGLRFNAPHEIFTDYYLSRFIRFSASSAQPSAFTSAEPPASLKFSSYMRFLQNPNLRFFENAMVMYIHSLVDESAMRPNEITGMLNFALATPPIDPKLFPSLCKLENPAAGINHIIPMNWIFLGRVFARETIRRRYTKVYVDVRDRLLKDLYKKTDFEFLYQKIYPIRKSFGDGNRDEKELPPKPSGREGFETMDQLWRTTNNSEKLLAIASAAENGFEADEDENDPYYKDIICRRVAYQLRYSTHTFNEESFEWAKAFWKNNSESHKELVVSTLRMVSDGLSRDKESLRNHIKDWIEEHTKDNKLHWEKHVLPFLTTSLSSQPNKIPEDYFRRIIENTDIDFTTLKNNQAAIAGLLKHTQDSFPSYIKAAFEILQQTEPNGRKSGENQILGKTLLFICAIAHSFQGQQLFMPLQYTLGPIGGHVPTKLDYEPAEVLDTLFKGALVSIEKESPLNQHNKDIYSIAGWQLYDFYVQAIWYIMRYVPSFAHYDYQN